MNTALTLDAELLAYVTGLAERCSDLSAAIGLSLVERPAPQRLADAGRVLGDLEQRLTRLRGTLAVDRPGGRR